MTAPVHPQLKSLTDVAPSFSGTKAIDVDGVPWGIVPGSRVHIEKRGSEVLVFVLTPEGDVHVLVNRGGKIREIIGSPAVARRLTALAKAEYFTT